jgi:hypothetical protein
MVENFPLLRFALTRPRRAEALDLAVSPTYCNDDDNDQREASQKLALQSIFRTVL